MKTTKFKRVLQEQGFTPSEFARKVSMSGSSIRYYARGMRVPLAPNAVKIAKALKMQVGDLF